MEMFEKYPVLQSAAVLLDSLPEVYESVVYTALYYPDKVGACCCFIKKIKQILFHTCEI